MNPRTWLPSLGLAALSAVAACSNDPTSTTNPPPPTTETFWDVDVVVRYVKASGTSACDGTTILGSINPGEFQYRIKASFGGASHSTESPNYGSVTGISYTLSTSEIYDFANQTWTFNNLKAGQAVALDLWATEWDGTSADSDLNNAHNSLNVTPSSLLPQGGTKTGRALGVGTSTCGLTLYYDVTARARQVTVP